MIESITIFLLFSLYFSSLNLKYLKLIKMELTRSAMKLFICTCFFTLLSHLLHISALSIDLMNIPMFSHVLGVNFFFTLLIVNNFLLNILMTFKLWYYIAEECTILWV